MKYDKHSFVELFPAVPKALAALTVAGLLSACSQPDAPSLEDLNASYEAAMAATADRAVIFAPGSETELQVLNRTAEFFAGMTSESVNDQVSGVYAADGYLNDNVVGIFGMEEIGAYFAHAASQSEVLDVKFLDVARSDTDYYIRWEMTVVAPVLAGGEPVVSYGTTQFRFDADGRVLIHKDFWDASTGMYEHIPFIGALTKYVHAKLAAGAEPATDH